MFNEFANSLTAFFVAIPSCFLIQSTKIFAAFLVLVFGNIISKYNPGLAWKLQLYGPKILLIVIFIGLFDFFKDTADGISKARSRWALVPGAITMPRTGRTAYLTKYTARVTEKQVFDLTGRNIDSATKFDQYLVARASLPEKAIIRSGLEPVEGTYRKVLRDDEYWIEPLAGTTTKLPEPIRYKILPRTMDTAKKMMGWADNIITDKPTSGTINDSLANILDKPSGQRTFLDKQTLQLYEQIVKIEEITVLADDGGLRVRPELVKERAKEIGLDIKFDRNYEEMIRVETDAIKRSGDNIPMSEIPAQAELNLLRSCLLYTSDAADE